MKQAAKQLLESGAVQVVIGFTESAGHRRRPIFVRKPEDVDRLVFDDSCEQNLAVYLTKPEVKALGKPAVVARSSTLRSILQLTTEQQFSEGSAIFILPEGPEARTLSTIAEIEQAVAGVFPESADVSPGSAGVCSKPALGPGASRSGSSAASQPAPLPADAAERFHFWLQEFSRCIRCFACRASCPMCYCASCLSEHNQPQWIPVPATALGNFHWHISRAMHLAGRCVDCGACTSACPVGIPLNLITQSVRKSVQSEFAHEAGHSATTPYPLSTFKPEERAAFIK